MMFDANLEENQTNEIQINGNVDLLKKMIDWIYSGDLEFPDDEKEIFDLILLADEYLLEDLKRKCEEELLLKISSTTS
jgi:speckle-type POZ protein